MQLVHNLRFLGVIIKKENNNDKPRSHIHSLTLTVCFLFLSVFLFKGFIPGPIVYGYLLDLSCLLWPTDCENEGFCYFYDVKNISIFGTEFYGGLNFLTCIFYFLAWRLYSTKSQGLSYEFNKASSVNGITESTIF